VVGDKIKKGPKSPAGKRGTEKTTPGGATQKAKLERCKVI